jgi:hypothetical protein
MEHLIYHSKQKNSFSITDQEEKSIRWLFQQSEDTLTSCIFSRLCYLPTRLLWDILTNACRSAVLAKINPGKLLEYAFWPHWNAAGTINSLYIEPDVFLRFTNVDILIEAKKDDGAELQNTEQHQKEVISYWNVYKQDNKMVYLLAIGGIGYRTDAFESVCLENGRHVEVISAHWKNIHYQVYCHLRQTVNRDLPEGIINVLRDIDLSFNLHGFIIGELLETLPYNNISNYYFPLFCDE